eukprot:scaffold68863_cov61-Phaeocystis_antarctica.AAC.5
MAPAGAEGEGGREQGSSAPCGEALIEVGAAAVASGLELDEHRVAARLKGGRHGFRIGDVDRPFPDQGRGGFDGAVVDGQRVEAHVLKQ